jgi:hypothetical protein
MIEDENDGTQGLLPSEDTIEDPRIAFAELRAQVSRLEADLAAFVENERSAFKGFATDIEGRIRQHPLAAVAIAYAAGRLLTFHWAARLGLIGYTASRVTHRLVKQPLRLAMRAGVDAPADFAGY